MSAFFLQEVAIAIMEFYDMIMYSALISLKGLENMSNNPIVTITMESGNTIKVELYPEMAPNTVNNFIFLINNGYYNGLGFHRIIPGFMIQGGCPQGNGMGGPGYTIAGEFADNGFKTNTLIHERGVISMARTMNPNSAGSQFFIMHQPAKHLDGQYAAFGRVIEGMDEVDRIAGVRTAPGDRPVQPEIMKSLTVETFGVEYPMPKRY